MLRRLRLTPGSLRGILPRMRYLLPLLGLLLPLAVGAADVRIVSVEPAGTPLNPDGRLWTRGHPARFWVRVENTSDQPWVGYREAAVHADLESVYGLPRERVSLAPREKRALSVVWDYPPDAAFTLWNGVVRTLPGPSWGMELRVWLREETGSVVAAGVAAFAVGQDGLPPPEAPRRATRPVGDAREAFSLRYGGYLRNPAYGPVAAERVSLAPGFPPEAVTAGTAPSGQTAYLVTLAAGTEARKVAVTFATPGEHLRRVYLLEPDATPEPRATRLYHLSEGESSTFALPACPTAATLVLETEPVHRYIPPVPLAEIAAAGEAAYGPVQFPLVGVPAATDPAAWETRRQELRERLDRELGNPQRALGPLEPRLLSEERLSPIARLGGLTRGYTRQKVAIRSATGEPMNVWLLIPPGEGPFPAVVALHQTVYEGKDEPVGLGGHYYVLDFGPYLVDRGFVVIAPDNLRTGERYDPDAHSHYHYQDLADQDPAWSSLVQNLRDQQRCLDYLETLPYVDAGRIGCIGHSLGGQSATVLAAMDPRIKAAVESCGFTLMRTFPDAAGTYTSVGDPILSMNMRKVLELPVPERKLGWDFSDFMALWAPTPVFLHDVKDELWPNAAQVGQAAVEVGKLYESLGAGERFRVVYSNQAHCFPSWVQPDTFDWLEYWLQGR